MKTIVLECRLFLVPSTLLHASIQKSTAKLRQKNRFGETNVGLLAESGENPLKLLK